TVCSHRPRSGERCVRYSSIPARHPWSSFAMGPSVPDTAYWFTADTPPARRTQMALDLTTGGKIRPITRWGTPVMHEQTQPVTEFGEELHELVRDMFATMRAAEGVGLAATQV